MAARRTAWTAAALAVLLSAVCTAAFEPGRSLLDDSPPAPCQLYPNTNKCSTSPLLVSSLPAPQTRNERLVAHYAALAYACSQHKAEPDCIADTQHFCEYQQDKSTNAPLCVLSPLVVLQHGADALLCDGSQVQEVYRCMLATDCTATRGCVALGEDKCMAAFQSELKGDAEAEWAQAFHKGEPAVWGKCKGAVQFRHLFAGCAKHPEAKCGAQPKCEWTARAAGRGGLCLPMLWYLERDLTAHKESEFSKTFWDVLKMCHNAAAPECNATITFTPNPAALLAYTNLSAVTASPDSPLIRGNGSALANNGTRHRHLNPEGPSKQHHHHHHKHKHGRKHEEEQQGAASAAPAPTGPASLGASAGRPSAGASGDDAPSKGALALLVLATIAAIAVVAGAAYIAYTHIRPRTSQYRPVLTADGSELGSSDKPGKGTPPHEP